MEINFRKLRNKLGLTLIFIIQFNKSQGFLSNQSKWYLEPHKNSNQTIEGIHSFHLSIINKVHNLIKSEHKLCKTN